MNNNMYNNQYQQQPQGNPYMNNQYQQQPQNPYMNQQSPYNNPYVSNAPKKNNAFVHALKSFFQNYANFQGCASPSEYWLMVVWNLIPLFLYLILILISSILGIIFVLVWGLGTFIPWLAIQVRRLHDSGHSGGFWFLNFIPFVGGIIFLVFMCLPSVHQGNMYRNTNINPYMNNGMNGGYNNYNSMY